MCGWGVMEALLVGGARRLSQHAEHGPDGGSTLIIAAGSTFHQNQSPSTGRTGRVDDGRGSTGG